MRQPDGIFGIFNVVRDFYEHGIDDHLWVFLLMVIIACDIAVGVSRAWAYHEFSSSKFRKGLVSHDCIRGNLLSICFVYESRRGARYLYPCHDCSLWL